MTTELYPQDLVLTPQDFADCGWKDALANSSREGYSTMWNAFSSAARQAIEAGRPSHGKALWLLADACSMTLSPKSLNEPYKPFMVMEDGRSAIPDDFSEADIEFFAQIADSVDDPWVRARLADLVWLKAKPRDVKYALLAIDACRSIPLDSKTWLRGGRECWDRALSLTRMLSKGAGDRLGKMETAILTAFNATTSDDDFLALWYADLLVQHGLGRQVLAVIAQKLESLARGFDNAGELHRGREYFRASAEWFKLAGNQAKSAEMTVGLAEGWAKEAVARIASENPSQMVATAFYENAIQTYRTIPRSERTIHRVDERMEELRRHLAEAGEKSLDEMGLITTPSVDISELIENARNAVKGKKLNEALISFSNLHPGAAAKKLREDAMTRLRENSLHAIFPATVMSRDGRVIAKRPGMSLMAATLTDDDELVIRTEMIRDYGILVSILVKGDIWPALEVLRLEHRLTESDFISLAQQYPGGASSYLARHFSLATTMTLSPPFIC